MNEQWVIPPDGNAAFVAAMEDVIEVYHRPHDPDRPVVCVDETSKQLIIEIRKPIPAKPGQPRRVDYEYKRNGTANLFMMFAPLEGWRDVKVTDQRAAVDYARMLKELSDTHLGVSKTWGTTPRFGLLGGRSVTAAPVVRPQPGQSTQGRHAICPGS